ncbi:MAG TPA: hypothetical protein VF815_05055 [Myxococcaceae bacterium]
MRQKSRWVSSLVLVWLWGCGAVELEDMEAPVLFVSAPHPSAWAFAPLQISVGEAGENCPDLSDDMKAFFNDSEVPLTTVGGWYDGSFMGPSAGCRHSLYSAEASALPPGLGEALTRIRITEGDTTLHAEAQDLCAPRRISVRSPADGVLRQGDTVVLEWQPANDALHVKDIAVQFTNGAGFKEGYSLVSTTLNSLQLEGNLLRFVMPPLPTAFEGPAELMFTGSSTVPRMFIPQATRCEGFVECVFDCSYPEVPYALNVTLQYR